MSLTIRIGFIGVDGSSIALAAEPTARASAVVFSAIDQLRRYFESNRNRASPAWTSLFHEIGQANIRDAEEKQQQRAAYTNQTGTAPPPQKSRSQAKKVIARKISLLSASGEKFIPGHEILNGSVQQIFFAQNNNNDNSNVNDDQDSYSSPQLTTFFWMDLIDPACKIQLSAFRPSSSSKNPNALNCFFSEVIDQTPFIASWNVEKVLQRVSEKCSGSYFIHPHDLECYCITHNNTSGNPYQTSTASTSVLMQRDAPLLDLFRYSRQVDLEVYVCLPPAVTVRVVEAAVAEVATKTLYSKLGFSSAPNDRQDEPSYYYSQLDSSAISPSRRRPNNNNYLRPQDELQVQNPYHSLADPYTFVETHSKRTISIASSTSSSGNGNSNHGFSISWSTTLSELHRETAKFVTPVKGKGFICLEPALILKSAEAAAQGDRGTTTLKLASTGKTSGSQIPVFSPDLTIRQVHRLMMTAHRNKGNSFVTENVSSQSSQLSCRLYLLVNSQEKEKPRMISSAIRYSEEKMREANEVRFQLLDVVFPASREARLLHQINSNTSVLKKQNVLPGSPDDTHLQLANNLRYRNINNNKSVRFQLENSFEPEQEQIQQQEDDFPMFIDQNQDARYPTPSRQQPQPQSQQQQATFEPAPTSPIHSEGVEAFISIPAVASSSSNNNNNNLSRKNNNGEVVRLLLPDGYFPVRRLKRFLKTQNSSNSEYQIQFGTKILNDDDEDVKHYVNPDTNVVFLNAF